ncbi:MAG TPA: IS3 family transposase [Gemmatimonadales bacterium]|nr:IS3 family transposase [Gemmatimonadales bacterium]
MATFIAAQGAQHQVSAATACQALGVSQAWFYKWRYGDASPRHARRAKLKAGIARLFAKHRGTYGSPRITADLVEAGWQVSENTVAAIMAELGLAARRRRRRTQTTRQGRGRWRAPDLIGRDFPASAVNRKWYGDGTEVPTDEGKLYLDSVLDMGSRRIVGFALGEHHDAPLAEAALQMAVAVRGGKEAIAGGHLPHRPGERVHRRGLPASLRPVRHHSVDGPGGLGAGQRGDRVLALHGGV